VMGSAGLPGLSGFVGEFLTLLGTFVAGGKDFPEWANYLPYPHLLAGLATTGVILGAVYLLYMFQKVFFGPLDRTKNGKLPDLNGRELGVFIPLVIGIFLMGIFPRVLLKPTEKSIESFIKTYQERLAEPDGPARVEGQSAPTEPAGDDIAGQLDRLDAAATRLEGVARRAAGGGTP